ncbi:MAG: hypothetical protein ACEPOW_08820 [Bacteroidales bacterium]
MDSSAIKITTTIPDYYIRTATQEDVAFVKNMVAQENWNLGENDIDFFAEHYPNDLYIGVYKEEPIASFLRLLINDSFGFCGLFIVQEEYRDMKFGITLALETYKYQNADKFILGKDGVLDQVPMYEKNGFVTFHTNARLIGIAKSSSARISKEIIFHAFSTDIPEEIFEFDKECFRTDRREFLEKWFAREDLLGVYVSREDVIQGYAAIRKAENGYVIGPIQCNTYGDAEILIRHLSNIIVGQQFYIEVPKNQPHFNCLMEDFELTEDFNFARMYNKKPKDIAINKIFGNLSCACG